MMNLTLDDYDVLDILGQGQFGKVYKVKRKDADLETPPIALKTIDINPDQTDIIETTKNEVEILKELSIPECNPFVICYYGSSHYDTVVEGKPVTRFLIEMELIDGEEMADYVTKLWDEKSKEMVYYYLLLIGKDILQGLAYTHDNDIIHNDIKLKNIMIDKENVPRIVDYGLSCTVVGTKEWGRYESKYCKSNGGTPDYVPPEFFIKDVRLPASDLWALGISLYIAATKNGYPYSEVDDDIGIQELFRIIRDGEPTKLNTDNQQLNDLVNGLLTKDPAKRLTAAKGLEMLENIPKPDSGRVPAPKIETSQIKTDLGSFRDMGPAQRRRVMSSFIML